MIQDIIGMKMKVIKSQNADAVGLAGKVVDDTRHTVIIQTNDGKRKRLIKSQHVFQLDNKKVPGQELIGRPEERIKRWTRGKISA
jgi:ribonuclease P protein subunit POP4